MTVQFYDLQGALLTETGDDNPTSNDELLYTKTVK